MKKKSPIKKINFLSRKTNSCRISCIISTINKKSSLKIYRIFNSKRLTWQWSVVKASMWMKSLISNVSSPISIKDMKPWKSLMKSNKLKWKSCEQNKPSSKSHKLKPRNPNSPLYPFNLPSLNNRINKNNPPARSANHSWVEMKNWRIKW